MTSKWKTRPLGELLEVQNGYAFDSQAFSPTGYMPLIRIRDLKSGMVTETRYTGDYNKRYVVNAGDLLIGMDGEFGCYQWKGPPGLLNQRVCRLKKFSADLLPRFLFYGINGYLKDIEDVTGYSTVKHLSSRQVLEIAFPVPPLPEQHRIVAILDKAFDAIATAKANTEKNLQNARAFFESHLHSFFAKRSDSWVTKPLAELCDPIRIITYGVIKLGDEVATGVPCLRTSNVRWLRIDTGGMKRIAASLSSEYSRTILKGGEVLVNVRGTLGGVAVATPEMAGWNVSREVSVVPVDPSRINPSFLAYWIASGASQEWLGGVKKGATYVGINIEDLRLLPVKVPKLEDQVTFVRHFELLQGKTQHFISIYRDKIIALDELKKSLLHQAFTGQL